VKGLSIIEGSIKDPKVIDSLVSYHPIAAVWIRAHLRLKSTPPAVVTKEQLTLLSENLIPDSTSTIPITLHHKPNLNLLLSSDTDPVSLRAQVTTILEEKLSLHKQSHPQMDSMSVTDSLSIEQQLGLESANPQNKDKIAIAGRSIESKHQRSINIWRLFLSGIGDDRNISLPTFTDPFLDGYCQSMITENTRMTSAAMREHGQRRSSDTLDFLHKLSSDSQWNNATMALFLNGVLFDSLLDELLSYLQTSISFITFLPIPPASLNPSVQNLLNNTLCIPVGQNFGGDTSAQNWEGIAKAREILAEFFSHTKYKSLIQKHKSILSLIQYSKLPHKNTKYIPATADIIHKGVFNQQNFIRNTPHNPFVDDNTIAEIRSRMPQAMAASVESLFLLLGQPDTSKRRSPLSMDKYYQAQCLYSKKQLGYNINTRTMMISFPQDKLSKMTNILHKWHTKRKSYTIRQSAELAGNLEFFASTAIWIRFLTYSIKNSILLALRANNIKISSSKSMRTWIRDTHLSDPDIKSVTRKHFAFSKIMKAVWNTKTTFFITIPLRNELRYLHHIFSSKKYKIQSPISHVIPRDPDYIAHGDACLDGAGGFSSKLKFWWFIPWPDAIQNRNIKMQCKYFLF